MNSLSEEALESVVSLSSIGRLAQSKWSSLPFFREASEIQDFVLVDLRHFQAYFRSEVESHSLFLSHTHETIAQASEAEFVAYSHSNFSQYDVGLAREID